MLPILIDWNSSHPPQTLQLLKIALNLSLLFMNHQLMERKLKNESTIDNLPTVPKQVPPGRQIVNIKLFSKQWETVVFSRGIRMVVACNLPVMEKTVYSGEKEEGKEM